MSTQCSTNGLIELISTVSPIEHLLHTKRRDNFKLFIPYHVTDTHTHIAMAILLDIDEPKWKRKSVKKRKNLSFLVSSRFFLLGGPWVRHNREKGVNTRKGSISVTTTMIKEQTNNNGGDVTEDKIYEKQTTTGRIVDSVPLLRFKNFVFI